jgi:hypothetical protein
MNNLYKQEFVNQALQAGIDREKIAAVLSRAEQITKRGSVKSGSAEFDIVDSIIKEAGLEKNASSVSYVQGIFNEAFNNGANVPQAIQFTKKAMIATSAKVKFMEKVSAIANDPKLSLYADGFIDSAKTAGLSQDEAVALLVNVVDREKSAAHGDDMFKGSPGGADGPPSPDSDPAAGAPPGGGAGGPPGGDPQEDQILQMLASLPPQEQQQIIQQLLAAISGGQGGPGAGAGGPPPGAGGPPPGAGAPPM